MIDKINEIRELLPNVFTPAAPISGPRFLQGRKSLLDDIYQAFLRRGSSILLYGERGVGKTSIAKVTLKSFKGNNFLKLQGQVLFLDVKSVLRKPAIT